MVPSKRCLELSLSGSIIRAIGARRVKLNRPIGYGGGGGGGGRGAAAPSSPPPLDLLLLNVCSPSL